MATRKKEDVFWTWVSRNIESLKQIRSGKEQVYREANKRLRRYHKGLVFEIMPSSDPVTIVISADGVLKNFPSVHCLCNYAPQNAGYKVVPFRSPMEFCQMTIGDIDFNPEDIFYKILSRRDRVDIAFYCQNYSNDREEIFLTAMLLLLDHGLGEYVVGTMVGRIEVRRYIGQPGLSKMPELAMEFESDGGTVA